MKPIVCVAVVFLLFLLAQYAMYEGYAQETGKRGQTAVVGQVVVATVQGITISTQFTGPFKSAAQCFQLMRVLLKSSNELPLPITKIAATCEVQTGRPSELRQK